MALRKLTKDHIDILSEKKICIVEKSLSYMEELCDNQCGLLSAVLCIVDTNKRNHGDFLFRGKKLEVYGTSCLRQLDFERTAILITSDYYREAYEVVLDILGERAAGTDIFYFSNKETEYEEQYRSRYRNTDLQDIIIFRSGPHASSYIKGMDFADNARALFEHALQTGLNRRYELVWFVKDPNEFGQYAHIENVSFLSFDWSISDDQEERDAYYRALCLAKYIFFTDAYGFARNCRSDQTRIQLWHGCGFKTRVNFVRCENRYEYTTVISDLYADIHADIYGLRKDQVLVTGYAKQDWLFHPHRDDMGRLHIPEADRYIFWLPTFRSAQQNLGQLNEYRLKSETGLPIVDSVEQMDRLNALLTEKNIVLVVKLHPFQDRGMVHCGNCSNIHLVENEDLTVQDIPVNRLLGQADALISDYSSAAVDFMLLDRPIAFMLEDVERYEQSRGFVFDNIREWLPGKELTSFEDLCDFVEEIDRGDDTTADRRRMLKGRMHKYCDDRSCQRILEAFLDESIYN
ncbi:MAG: CDP-glycerol glycerophosphotransferase family protein [Lachnospiraceae bacterium]|jgi:CDP-glycerol glycerophosphotransferase (TagB/SpsB family)